MMLPARGRPPRLVPPFALEASHLFAAVGAASPDEVWVVGQAQGRPLAARWDGTSWSVPRGPAAAAALVGAGLEGVAVGPSEAIAVGGGYDRLLGTEVPIIRHWDGTAWTDAAAPADLTGSVLTDVTLVGPGQAWAVGHGFPRGNGGPGLVALHWNGDVRQTVPMPSVARGKLLAVAATSPDDVWAVGADGRKGLIVHFDGDRWHQVPCPSTRFPLTDVAAVSSREAWCAGGGVVLRWNGRKWARADVPIGSANTITAASPTEVWAGGGRGELAHFDGRHWTVVSAPGPVGDGAVWKASTVTGEEDDRTVWLVGSHRVGGPTGADHESSITAQQGEA